jgi:hypothetical protein
MLVAANAAMGNTGPKKQPAIDPTNDETIGTANDIRPPIKHPLVAVVVK